LTVLGALLMAGCTPGADREVAVRFEPRFSADPDCFGLDIGRLKAEDVSCATVTVPLHHDEPEAGTIDLAVAMLAGRRAEEFDQPTLLLGGGPGLAVVEPFLTSPGPRMVLDVGPDLVVFDQRGIGLSRPALDCPELVDLELEWPWVDDPTAELAALAACRERLVADGVDLDAFSHRANARDVDLIRRALGVEQLDLLALSYGTLVALLAAAEHPEGVRTMILDAPVDPMASFVDDVLVADRMVREVAARCGRDAGCSAVVDDLEVAIEETLDRLAAAPEAVTITAGFQQLTVTVGPEAFTRTLFRLAYSSKDIALLPAAVARAHEGWLEPIVRLADPGPWPEELSAGMYLSMSCSGIPADLAAQLWQAERASGRLVNPWGGAYQQRLCELWDVERSFDPEQVSLDVDIPTLVVAGGLDLITPPELAERVHASLPASTLLLVPDAVHTPLLGLGPCGRRIAADFLRDPEAPLDDACASESHFEFAPELPSWLRGSGGD
jgi:pimeloyl-ACP methyl ester carboxylesterase